MNNLVGHLINGEMTFDNENSRTQDVFNPATGLAEKKVALASKQTVEEAISAAQAAFPAWRNTPPIKRARVMFRFKELLQANADKICEMIGQEHGKISKIYTSPLFASTCLGLLCIAVVGT